MMFNNNKLVRYLLIGIVLIGIFLNEVEARRKIIPGRKSVTKRYYKTAAVPAWGIVVICGGSFLIVGGILYTVMRKIVIGSITSSNVKYSPANPNI